MINRRTFSKSLLGLGSVFIPLGNSTPSVFAIGTGQKLSDIKICELKNSKEHFAFRTPIKFGGRVTTQITIFKVDALVENRSGQRGRGRGSMTIGNSWSWPSQILSSDRTETVMEEFGRRLVEKSGSCSLYGHPLELCRQLSIYQDEIAKQIEMELQTGEPIPKLSQLNMASPMEAALFDAYGKLYGESVFNLLGPDYISRDLSFYLNDDFKGEYLDRYTFRKPRARMPLYHLIGGLDPLTEKDIKKRINDGLPETLAEWIHSDGLTHLKIKLNGNNLENDVQRTVQIEEITSAEEKKRGVDRWFYSADFNEKCPNEEYVLDWMTQVERYSRHAFQSLMYIEQPTNRNLKALPKIEMHRASKRCPVVIDESLVDFESLLLCREMGYSGVALKACKGMAEALLMGAAARKYKLFLCVQDLTCPGESFLQSASLAAHIPTVAAVEGNARQYCPAANAPCKNKFPGLFNITDGTVETNVLDKPGLGF